MRSLDILLLTLLTVVNAKKNFRTGDLPIGFDHFTVSEESAEVVQNETKLEPNFIDWSKGEEHEGVKKSGEEEQELAKILAWEQNKIKELQKQREQMSKEKREEVEKVMKEQAEERARIETAREARRRQRLYEQRKMLEDAKKERERQEKLIAELERQKIEELKRLEEQKERERKKAEEEHRRWLEEEKRKKEQEEEERKRREAEEVILRRKKDEEEMRRREEIQRRKQEEEDRRQREEEIELQRLKQEEERRKLEEEREQQRKEEERIHRLREENRRRIENEKKKRAEEDKHRRKQEEERKKLTEEYRRMKEKAKLEKTKLVGKRRGQAKQEGLRKKEKDGIELVDDRKSLQKKQELLKRSEEHRGKFQENGQSEEGLTELQQKELEQMRQEEKEKLGSDIERRQMEEQRMTRRLERKHQMEDVKVKPRDSNEDNGIVAKESSVGLRRLEGMPKTLSYKLARRRRQLLARFGTQARRTDSGAKSAEESREESDDDRSGSSSEGRSEEIQLPQKNDVLSSVQGIVEGSIDSRSESVRSQTKTYANKQNALVDGERALDGTYATLSPGRTLVRQRIKKNLQGIRTYSELHSQKESFEEIPTPSDAGYLGGWSNHIGQAIEGTERSFTSSNIELEKTLVPTEPTAFGSTYQTAPPEHVPIVVQPVLISSPDQHDFSVTQTSEHSVDDEYMRAYYEQYYKEWYRQHNIASMTTTPPATAEPTQRRQIKIKMGQPWSAPEAPSTQELPQANQSVGRAGVEGMMAGSTTTLSAEQLDKICLDIHKTTTGFGIRDPKSFALNNCPLIKMYYKQVTCEQINHVMDYCEQRSLLR